MIYAKTTGCGSQNNLHATKKTRSTFASLSVDPSFSCSVPSCLTFLVKPFLQRNAEGLSSVFENDVLSFTGLLLQLNINNLNNSIPEIYSSVFTIFHKRACCHQNHHPSHASNDNTTPQLQNMSLIPPLSVSILRTVFMLVHLCS